MAESSRATSDPLATLEHWLEQAAAAGVSAPRAMTLATATIDGRPSARLVTLKELDRDALVFTTALWTRKVEELRANPRAAATFHWPTLGRQARVEGCAEIAERGLAERLFSTRPRSHQLQAHVSRQGEEIENLDTLRARLETLKTDLGNDPILCPDDWGAVRLVPDRVELWEEAEDRLHDRELFERDDGAWRRLLLAP